MLRGNYTLTPQDITLCIKRCLVKVKLINSRSYIHMVLDRFQTETCRIVFGNLKTIRLSYQSKYNRLFVIICYFKIKCGAPTTGSADELFVAKSTKRVQKYLGLKFTHRFINSKIYITSNSIIGPIMRPKQHPECFIFPYYFINHLFYWFFDFHNCFGVMHHSLICRFCY